MALTEQELRDLGVESPEQADLADVLLRAALGTAAGVRIVPADVADAPAGGVGAVLRYADDSPN